jgi:hypothetical protein
MGTAMSVRADGITAGITTIITTTITITITTTEAAGVAIARAGTGRAA